MLDFEKLVKMQKEFSKLNGVCDITESHVQLNEEVFMNRFNQFNVKDRDNELYPYECNHYFKGVKFITVLNEKEYYKYVDNKTSIC